MTIEYTHPDSPEQSLIDMLPFYSRAPLQSLAPSSPCPHEFELQAMRNTIAVLRQQLAERDLRIEALVMELDERD